MTPTEEIVWMRLMQAHSEYLKLPIQHPDERSDFLLLIRQSIRMVMARATERDHAEKLESAMRRRSRDNVAAPVSPLKTTTTDQPPKPGSILRLRAVKERTGLPRSSIYEKMADGSFPRSIPLGAKAVGWIEHEIDKWMSDLISKRDQCK